MKKTILLLALVSFVVTSCYYDNAEELYKEYQQTCDVSAVTYSQDVSKIIAQNCAYSGCHVNPGAAANLDLSTYNDVAANKDNVKSRINLPAGNASVMPASGPMNSCNIQLVTAWIDNGALNN